MKDTIQSTEVSIDVGTASPSALREQQWVVTPEESTSIDLETLVTRFSGSVSSEPAGSSTSMWFADSKILGRLFQQHIDYYQVIITEMLQAIDSGVIRSFIGSADFSTPVFDNFSEYLDASTAKNEVDRLFSLATFIDLEPGTRNGFSEGIELVIERHGGVALDALKDIILNEETASSIAMEALKYVGNTDSIVWHNERRLMLETCLLESSSAWVRDGAGLGLSFLGDVRSISTLEQAIKQETSQALKADLSQILYRLKKSTSES